MHARTAGIASFGRHFLLPHTLFKKHTHAGTIFGIQRFSRFSGILQVKNEVHIIIVLPGVDL
jgi:hypothetical protein